VMKYLHQEVTELFLPLGVSCEELSPVKNEESSLEDSTVTLSYTYSKQADGNDYFFWYRQYPGKPPEFLFYISGLNDTRPAESLKSDTKFSTKLSEEKRDRLCSDKVYLSPQRRHTACVLWSCCVQIGCRVGMHGAKKSMLT
uniref:Immunoglobulin V-set domain-containing protein n=1 Tax=Sparus aurata TaxID=8175 RepID=A0A671U326_SPAAU